MIAQLKKTQKSFDHVNLTRKISTILVKIVISFWNISEYPHDWESSYKISKNSDEEDKAKRFPVNSKSSLDVV